MKHPKIVTAILTTVILLVLVIVIGLVVVYSGLPNVAASKPDGAVTSWVLGTTMEHSVRRQAAGISPDLSRGDLAEGAEHYEAMCVVCHGGPGREPGEIGRGLNPVAPDLRESAGDWKPGEIYWIVQHGIKMTGMPAFGKTHSSAQLTNIVAFVEKLPTLKTEEYRHLTVVTPTTNKSESTEPSHHHD